MEDLRIRFTAFSKDVISYVKSVPQNTVSRPLCSQLIRSATSIGANYIEARQAISRRDFRAKVYIAKKEAAETLYWLDLMTSIHGTDRLQHIANEAHEITKILQKITQKLQD